MKHRQSVIEVKIILDDVPGWGYAPEDHVQAIQVWLDGTIPHYKPEVKLIKVEEI